MPTYEYKCSACGQKFEKFQSITAAPIRKCPKCGKNKVQRLIGTGAGLIFKGSGFYITDYRDAGYKDQAKADAPPSDAAAAKGDSDTKSQKAPPAGDGSAAAAKPAAEPKPAEKSESKPQAK